MGEVVPDVRTEIRKRVKAKEVGHPKIEEETYTQHTHTHIHTHTHADTDTHTRAHTHMQRERVLIFTFDLQWFIISTVVKEHNL